VLWWRELVGDGLWVAFTDKTAGNLALHVGDVPAAVQNRRRTLEAELGMVPGSLRFMNQVHSANVGIASTAQPAPPPETEIDALVSPQADVPLAVMVADCLPVVFVGSAAGGGQASAVAHAGRQGLLDGVLVNTVSELRAAGVSDIRAWIGPSICGRCYEVPGQMRAASCEQLPQLYSETSWGTPALDLPAGAAAQLETLDVETRRPGGCTLEDSRLFSYRRNPQTGRFAGLVWREDD
jgi:YfiH family protein